jgi:asparagine synthase (glutamine-hydrolysing)
VCGIAGAINWGDRETVLAMTEALAHRGPDDQGLWEGRTSDGVWVGLGHRRLSIIDLSPAGHQPMSNEDGRFWVVFNGEIYNFQELRKELLQKGHRFRSNSDTEVILHLYETLGEGCLEHLRGMFAFGIWDCERQELFLARDRLGIKPLYYAERGGRLLFASELKAILKHPEIGREVDYQALHEYLTYLYIPPPRTIYKDIQSLPPGHFLAWRGGIARKERYWRLPEDRLEGEEEDLTGQLRSLLEESVRLRMISDVPVGAFLSGGVDSSGIVGLMARQTSHPVQTFSIGFSERARLYNELEYARCVAKHFGTDHHEILVEPDAVSLLPKMVEGFDEPFGNPTAFLVYLLSEFTRRHVTVALAGDGGDEVFGGYPRYKGAALSRFYRTIPRWFRRATFEQVAAFIPESSRGRHGLRRFREFVQGSALSPEDMYCNWVTYYTDGMKAELYSQEMAGRVEGQDSYEFLKGLFREAGQRERDTLFDRITAVDLQSFLPCNLLAYTDRMSMAHALEVRVPFTDHKLVEFATRLFPALRLRGMQDKYLLKKAVGDLLPEAVLKRKKLGFNPPMALWLKEDLHDLVRDCLSEEVVRRRGYFRPEAVRSLLYLHQSGRRDLSLHIWALLVLEVWHRMYLDP